jgi:hypothetical protein
VSDFTVPEDLLGRWNYLVQEHKTGKVWPIKFPPTLNFEMELIRRISRLECTVAELQKELQSYYEQEAGESL